MSGKIEQEENLTRTICHSSFADLMGMQMSFQRIVIDNIGYDYISKGEKLPVDRVHVASYHNQALMEEVGELIKSDKRWKNYRNEFYDKENKIEELADCFITLMNIAMFSGVGCEEMQNAIEKKIGCNFERVSKVCREGSNT